VELDADNPNTGETTDHEDENTGNFYMTDGTLTITNYTGKAVKADGTATFSGGTKNFGASDIETVTGIEEVPVATTTKAVDGIYDLQGHRLTAAPQRRTLYIIVKDGEAKKFISK